MKQDDLFILNTIAQIIYDKKGMNILVLDVRKCSSLTDYVVIAEGNVDKHVVSIAHAVHDVLKEFHMNPEYKQGLNTGDWVVLDYLQVMIHLFVPDVRDKYHLEELWKEGEVVDVSIDLTGLHSVTYGSSMQSVSF